MTMHEAFDKCAENEMLVCRPLAWRGYGLAIGICEDEDGRTNHLTRKIGKPMNLYSMMLDRGYSRDMPMEWLSYKEWEVISTNEMECHVPPTFVDLNELVSDAQKQQEILKQLMA